MAVSISGWDGVNEKKIADGMRKAMEETVSFTKEVIVDTIETSGTDKQWSRSWGGRTGSGAGRVNTGNMRNSVGTDVKVLRNNIVEGRAGWLKGTPEYAKFQELGFRHWITGEFIAGMHSLLEGATQGTEEALRQLEKAAMESAK